MILEAAVMLTTVSAITASPTTLGDSSVWLDLLAVGYGQVPKKR